MLSMKIPAAEVCITQAKWYKGMIPDKIKLSGHSSQCGGQERMTIADFYVTQRQF